MENTSFSLPYAQNIEGCLSRHIGPHGLGQGEMQQIVDEAAAQLQLLRREIADQGIPALTIVQQNDDLDALRLCACKIAASATDVVLFGIGGSALAPRVLQQLQQFLHPAGNGTPRLHVMDNPETPWMERFLSALDIDKVHFLIISKSGATAETVMQTLWAIDYLQVHGLGSSIPERMLIITEPSSPEDNPLRRLALAYDIPTLSHPPDIGGRYAAFSIVGMLPAYLLGLDAARLREGGRKVLDMALADELPTQEIPPVVGAALHGAFMRSGRLSSTIMMPYTSQLTLFTAWWRQLWAESIGKDGKGPLPVNAVGPVDQHSQLQLFLDGPNDKLFTILMPNTAGHGYRAPRYLAADEDERLACLGGRTIGDLTDCEQRATVKSLMRKGRPVRTIAFDALNEELIGALFMHFMLETILACRLAGVNPFDQPAVEFSKQITRELLRKIEVPKI